MLQALDLSILRFVDQAVGHMPHFDELVVLIAQNDLVKGAPLVALLWWYWFKKSSAQTARKEIIVACVVAALAAAATSRLLAHTLMFHQRPFMIPSLQLAHRPATLWEDKDSSFPSDHAALAFGLVTGLYFVSRKVGLAMAGYAIVLVCLPRVYLGMHWPSDIAGGAALGGGFSACVCRGRVRAWLAGPVIRLGERSPHLFYALAFLVSFGLMTRFDSARALYSWASSLARPGAAIDAEPGRPIGPNRTPPATAPASSR